MPLNYSKWDKLELSDDSDIEGHPNVDKKSLIRWKQRDIHEKREARKLRIADLAEELKTSNILLPRIASLASAVSANGPGEFSQLTERLKSAPSPAGPAPFAGAPPGAPKPPSYDEMLLQLLYKVWDDVREAQGAEVRDAQRLEKALVAQLRMHEGKLGARVKECQAELRKLEEEQKEKITSDDIHEGWDSKYVPVKSDDVPIAPSAPPPKHKKAHRTKETVVETLNAPQTPTLEKPAAAAVPHAEATSGYEPDAPADADADGDDGDDESDSSSDELPTLTPALLQFSRIPVGKYAESYAFLQSNRSILAPGSMDALFVAAFQAEMRGESRYARAAVHQALLLQYCEKLGGDGIRLFFQKMSSGSANAQKVFMQDVDSTYKTMKERVLANKAASAEGRETIQLQVESPGTSVSFNVPEGPPPAAGQPLQVDFEGVDPGEQPDVEEIRSWLARRWDIWQAFPKKLRRALESKSLERVNKVLEDMSVEQAEQVVADMQASGILNFAEEGIRDETPAGKAAREAALADGPKAA